MRTIDVMKAIDRHIEECSKEELACIYNDLINPVLDLEASDILDFDESMTVEQALQLILNNSTSPALNYCIRYTNYALSLIRAGYSEGTEYRKREIKTQLLYVLNNMTHWRAHKNSDTTFATAAEIKECRAVLKKASV